jgi:hypothetical protein
MSLQIRRGIDSQRTGVIFDQGEISWTTDTNKLYVGDGVTAGGINVVASAAGTGLTWNSTTQTLNFSGAGLGLTTDVVTEGVTYGRVYFTNARAQSAVASMFTTLGTTPTTGNVTGTIGPSQVTVSGGTSGMNVYIPFVVVGTGGGGLTAGTYYVCTIVDASHITLSSSLALAQSGTAIATFTTASISGTTYTAGGNGTGTNDVFFTYNPTTQTFSANVTLNATGITAVVQDTAPQLGGNLTLNGKNITGTGNINITGSLTTSSTINGVTISSGAVSGVTTLGIGGTVTQSTGNLTYSGTYNSSYTNGTLTYPQLNIGQLNVTPANAFGGLGGILAQTQGNTNTDAFQLFSLVTANSASAANQAFFSRSRGTLVAPTTVTAGDGILTFQYVAQSPTTQVAVAGITANASANGTISSGVVPGQLVFQTANASGTLVTGLTIDGPTNSVNVGTYLTQSITPTITAQGTNQAGALALTTHITVVTTVTTNSGVALPAAVAGMIITVYNAGANALNVYTVSGGSARINSLGTTAAYSLSIGTGIRFLAASTTQWYTI